MLNLRYTKQIYDMKKLVKTIAKKKSDRKICSSVIFLTE